MPTSPYNSSMRMTPIHKSDAELIETGLLSALVCLIEEGGVSAAARRLGKSQPAVSHMLGQLRARFNDPLLIRSGSRMHPTPQGLALAREGAAVLEQVRQLCRSVRRFDPRQDEGLYVISAPEYVDQFLTPRVLARLAESAPLARLQIRPPNPEMSARQLESGEVDLRIGWVDHVDPATRARLLYTERQLCLARARHPRIRGQITAKQYAEEQHVRLQVSAPSTASRSLDQMALQTGLKLKVRAVVPSLMTLARLVAESDLLATVPEGIAGVIGPLYKLQTLPLPLNTSPVKVAMYWHEKYQRDVRHTWLRDLVAKVVASRTA